MSCQRRRSRPRHDLPLREGRSQTLTLRHHRGTDLDLSDPNHCRPYRYPRARAIDPSPNAAGRGPKGWRRRTHQNFFRGRLGHTRAVACYHRPRRRRCRSDSRLFRFRFRVSDRVRCRRRRRPRLGHGVGRLNPSSRSNNMRGDFLRNLISPISGTFAFRFRIGRNSRMSLLEGSHPSASFPETQDWKPTELARPPRSRAAACII